MLVAIETSTSSVGVAIGDAGGVAAQVLLSGAPRHAEKLVPAIEWCVDNSGITMADLDTVAVDLGPGLFTGLRVGVATAKALAFALGIEAVGFVSLDLLAWEYRFVAGLVAAVADGRRGECFLAVYRTEAGSCHIQGGHRLVGKADLAGELAGLGEGVLAVGDGALRYGEELAAAGNVTVAGACSPAPSAAAMVALGSSPSTRPHGVDPIALEPLYLREPDAKIGWAPGVSMGAVR